MPIDPVGAVTKWLFSRALKKAAVTAAQAVGAWALAHGEILGGLGLHIGVDPDALAVGLLAGSEVLRNWLKLKWPRAFKRL